MAINETFSILKSVFYCNINVVLLSVKSEELKHHREKREKKVKERHGG